MAFVQFLPLIIMTLLLVATISLFVFWLGRPTRKKLHMAKLSLGYLFLLNALLALTVNIMLIKDVKAIEIGPLSLLMLILPLAVGALLYRGGCQRYAQMSLEEALQFDGGQKPKEEKGKKRQKGKGGQWKVLDDKQGEATLQELRASAPKGTWAMILLLVSALAYAPAIFMLQGNEINGVNGGNAPQETTSPQAKEQTTPSPAPSPIPSPAPLPPAKITN